MCKLNLRKVLVEFFLTQLKENCGVAAGGRQMGLEGIELLEGFLLICLVTAWYLPGKMVVYAGNDTAALSKKKRLNSFTR